MSNKNASAVELSLQNSAEAVKTVSLALKAEARRMVSVKTLETLQTKSNNGLLFHCKDKWTFEQYQQYMDLICLQFAVRLDEIVKKYNLMKQQCKRIASDMEKDPSQVSRLATLKNNQAKLEEELLVAYRQHYLLMNYRMDIAAKVLQRWTGVLSQRVTDQIVTKSVNSLFE